MPIQIGVDDVVPLESDFQAVGALAGICKAIARIDTGGVVDNPTILVSGIDRLRVTASR